MNGRITSTSASVTPEGIRDADPVVLALLVQRRAGNVLAYVDEVTSPDLALRATGEAFAAFRIAVATADPPTAVDPETALKHAMRQAAARHAENPFRPHGRERPAERTHACELMPRLLVAWTETRLSEADEQRVVRHLRTCSDCRALNDAFARAEQRYAEGPPSALDATDVSVVVTTMAAAPLQIG
ncbi:MAG: zf-HC2 domain-containing protein, partial [Solirubrobacteraceae bacterium]